MKNILKITTITTFLVVAMGTTSVANENTGNTENGAQLWADTCMRCHNLRTISGRSKSNWSISMSHMRVRAGLTGQETRDILAFILASKTTEDTK
jgi:cytochrome c